MRLSASSFYGLYRPVACPLRIFLHAKRTQDEYGGDWSMATSSKATETDDEATRKKLLDAILTYNREDLAATWAVFEWLRWRKVA